MPNYLTIEQFLTKTSEELKSYHKLKFTWDDDVIFLQKEGIGWMNLMEKKKMLMIQLETIFSEKENIILDLKFAIRMHDDKVHYNSILDFHKEGLSETEISNNINHNIILCHPSNEKILTILSKIIPILTNLQELDISGYTFIDSCEITQRSNNIQQQKKLFAAIQHCKKLKQLNIRNNYFNFIDNKDLFLVFMEMIAKNNFLEKIYWDICNIVHMDDKHLPKYLPDLLETHAKAIKDLKEDIMVCGTKTEQLYIDEIKLLSSITKEPFYKFKSMRYTKEQKKLLEEMKDYNKKTASMFFAFASYTKYNLPGDVKKIIFSYMPKTKLTFSSL